MRKVFLFHCFLLLLTSCAFLLPSNRSMSSSIGAEKIKVDFFEEWGLTRSTAYGIVVERNGKFVPTDSSFNKICGELFNKHAYFFAARFFQDDSSKKISIECFQQQPEPLNSKDMIQRGFLSDVFGKTAYHLVLSDSAYHILYNGDSIHFVSGVYYNHKKVCAEKSKEKCSFGEVFEKERNEIYFSGPFYEITFPANARMHSLSIQKNFDKYATYWPLKLDPSILPLESPGYKRLREQEETLSK